MEPNDPQRLERGTPRLPRIAARTTQKEEELRPNLRTDGTRLQRLRKRTEDKFFIPQNIIDWYAQQGLSIEWKRNATYGKPDTFHITALGDNHWSPVEAGKWPGLLVEQDGMVLMQRPAYLTEEARAEDLEIARSQVQGSHAKLAETPQGQFTRDHPSARANTRISTSYAPAPGAG